MELGYSAFIKRTMLNFSIFARSTNNSIQSIRDVVGLDTVRTTYANIGQENAYGFSINGNVNVGKLMDFTAAGKCSYKATKAVLVFIA